MPSKSKKQARTMRAAAHDPQFAKKVGIPQRVARDYVEADQRRQAGDRGEKRSGIHAIKAE